MWADHVGGERGELVVVQCELARGTHAPADVAALRERERELIARHGEAWGGGSLLGWEVEFRRGFVEAAMGELDAFVDHAGTALEAAPLLDSLALVAESDAPAQVERLLGSPIWPQIRALHLVGLGDRAKDALEILERTGALERLRGFGMSGRQLTGCAWRLAHSRTVGSLDTLWIRDTRLENYVWGALLRATRPRSLALLSPGDLRELAPFLDAVTELELTCVRSGELRVLGLGADPPAVEALTLLGPASPFEALAPFSRLRALDLRGVVGAREADYAALAGFAWPALRRLICAPITASSALALARAFGPQLELLELAGTVLGPAEVAELRALVAGELLISPDWMPLPAMLLS